MKPHPPKRTFQQSAFGKENKYYNVNNIVVSRSKLCQGYLKNDAGMLSYEEDGDFKKHIRVDNIYCKHLIPVQFLQNIL